MSKPFKKVEVHLDDVYGVPDCYAEFFITKEPKSEQKAHPNQDSNQDTPFVTIKVKPNPKKQKKLLTLLYISDCCTTIDQNSIHHELRSRLSTTVVMQTDKGKKYIEIRGNKCDQLIAILKAPPYNIPPKKIVYIPLPQPKPESLTDIVPESGINSYSKYPKEIPAINDLQSLVEKGNPLFLLEQFNARPGSYEEEMRATILDQVIENNAEYDKIHIDSYLDFIPGPVRDIFSKDGKKYLGEKRFWSVKFDLKDSVSIDQLISGSSIAPMDNIIVTCKDADLSYVMQINLQNTTRDNHQGNLFKIQGKVQKINKTVVEASFLLPVEIIPPDLNIFDNDTNFKDLCLPVDYVPPDDNIIYHITFTPSLTVYRRSALALLTMDKLPKNNIIKRLIADTFERPDIGKIRQPSLKLPDGFDAGYDLTESKLLTNEERTNNEFMNRLIFSPEGNQQRCVESAIRNKLCLIQGPPGCGKSQIIASIIPSLFKYVYNTQSKNRILVCAYSNMAVANIIKYIGPVSKALGKKLVWIASSTKDFKTKEEFEQTSGVKQFLSLYQILTRKTQESYLYQKYQEKVWKGQDLPHERDTFDKIRKTIEVNLISEADIVCCTTSTSAYGPIRNFKFSAYILDEATQSDEISSVIPLIHQPERVVLIGDQMQLDPLVSDTMKRNHPETSQSLFTRLVRHSKSYGLQCEMLDVQYRMHPSICDFPNRAFYGNKIQSQAGLKDKRFIDLTDIGLMSPLQFINVDQGQEELVFGTSYQNQPEAEIVVQIVLSLIKADIKDHQIGVITPYYGQVKLIRKLLNQSKFVHPTLKRRLKISPVDRFQGSERDIIILSFVRSNPMGNIGFLTNFRRLNVSLTRARCCLIAIGHKETLSHVQLYRDFCDSFQKCTIRANDLSICKRPTMDVINSDNQATINGITIQFRTKNRLELDFEEEESIFKPSIPFYKKNSVSLSNQMNLIWPDVESNSDSLSFFQKWVNLRLGLLSNGQQVTLSVRVTDMFIEIMDIYNKQFDVLSSNKKNNKINDTEEEESTFGSDDDEGEGEDEEDEKELAPSIGTSVGFIIFLYDKVTDDEASNLKHRNMALLPIIQPLLEHQQVTLITYNMIPDLTFLSSYGVHITTSRIIDTELFSRINNNPATLLSDNDLASIKETVSDVEVTQDFIRKASEIIHDPSFNDFETDNYNELVLSMNPTIPLTSIITEQYLKRHCSDTFLSSIICSELYNKGLISQVHILTTALLQQYTEKIQEAEEPGAALFYQNLSFIRTNSPNIKNLPNVDLYSDDELIKYWISFKRIYKLLTLCSPEYVKRFVQITADLTLQRIKSIEERLSNSMSTQNTINRKCQLGRPIGYIPTFT